MSEKKVGSGDKIITLRLKPDEFIKLQKLITKFESDKSNIMRMGLNTIYNTFFNEKK